MKCLRAECPRGRHKDSWEPESHSSHCCAYCFNDEVHEKHGHTQFCNERHQDMFGFGVDPENPNQCITCFGSGADPDDPGDWVPEAGMHNPYTAAPCPTCDGTGERRINA